MRANSRNILATSKHYPRIMQEYNKRFEEKNGKVNKKGFWEEIIHPIVPDYSLSSWYNFLSKFETHAGLAAAHVTVATKDTTGNKEESKLEQNLISNEVATQMGINLALNIGKERLQQVAENPSIMTPKEAVELLFKAMKAQDSRVQTIGKVREDNRQQQLFDKAFKDAAYES